MKTGTSSLQQRPMGTALPEIAVRQMLDNAGLRALCNTGSTEELTEWRGCARHLVLHVTGIKLSEDFGRMSLNTERHHQLFKWMIRSIHHAGQVVFCIPTCIYPPCNVVTEYVPQLFGNEPQSSGASWACSHEGTIGIKCTKVPQTDFSSRMLWANCCGHI